jgi:hypothetical protein
MANEPGSKEENSRIQELLKAAQTEQRYLKLQIIHASEVPTKMLEPEAHEDALKAEKGLWREGIELLGKDKYCQIKTPNNQVWNLYAKKDALKFDDAPINTEYVIFGPMNRHVENVNGEDIEYTNHVMYMDTPTGVIMVERNWANAIPRNNLPFGEPRTPRGLSLQKTEIGRDEINELVGLIRTRTAHYPNQG